MKASYREVQAEVLGLMSKLASDWEYSGQITPETSLFADLGFESLDLVVLGTAIQERYRQPLPFAEFLTGIGQRNTQDVSVGELVRFVYQHLGAGSPLPAGPATAR